MSAAPEAQAPAVAPAVDPAPPKENGAPAADKEATAPVEPSHKVFVGNLAYSTTDEGLKGFFAPVQSDILSTQIILRGNRSAGYGFVSFSSLDAAKNAVEQLDKKELDGRTVIVEVAKPPEEKDRSQKRAPRRFHRKPKSNKAKDAPDSAPADAAPATTTAPADATQAGAADAPKPKKKSGRTRKTRGSNKGTADTSAAPADADTAAPATTAETTPKKKKRPARQPRRPRAEGEAPTGEPSKTTLFVANVGFSMDDNGLAELFTSNGLKVVSARIVKSKFRGNERSKGYGFVDVGGEEEQKKALEALNGKDVGGREIVVKIAVDAPHEKKDAPADAADAADAAPAAAEAPAAPAA